MAGPNLEVVISAKVDGLERGVNQAQKTLHQFAGSTEDVDKAMAELDSRLRVIQGNAELFGRTLTTDVQKIAAYRGAISDLLSKGVNPTSPKILDLADKVRVLNDEASEAPAAFNKMNRSMGQGQSAAISFNRVIQDAPFGIMGVSNNITQLAEQFVYLKQSTGSSSAAFKTALGALFSPMNLVVLGISAITSALTFYSMRSRSAGSETKAFADTLTGLAKSSLQGEQAAQQQIVSLELLYAVTQDNTRSLRDRNRAVDELQRMYPAYFGNLSNESILTGNATAQYNKLRDAILQVANARAAEELLVENRKREIALGREIADQAARNAKSLAESEAINRRAQQNRGPGNAGAGAMQQGLNNATDAGIQKVIKLGEELSKLNSVNNELVADVQKLPYGLEASLEPADKLNEKFKRMSDQIYKLRAISMTGKIQMPELQPPSPLQLTIEIGSVQMTGVMTEMELAAEQAANLFNQTFGRIVLGEDTDAEVAKKIQNVQNSIGEALGNIAGNIGDAIASGGNVIEAFGRGVIDAFGQFLSNFGKKLIEYGLAAGAFAKLQLAMLNPITAIPAAGAAIAAGLVLMAAGAAASSAASGMGNVAGQGSQSQNVTSGTVVRPAYAEASNQPQTLIRGRDLVTLVEMNTKYKGR